MTTTLIKEDDLNFIGAFLFTDLDAKLLPYKKLIANQMAYAVQGKNFEEFLRYTDQILPEFIMAWDEIFEYSLRDSIIQKYLDSMPDDSNISKDTNSFITDKNRLLIQSVFDQCLFVHQNILDNLQGLSNEQKFGLPIEAKEKILEMAVNYWRIIFVLLCAVAIKNEKIWMYDFFVLHIKFLIDQNKENISSILNEWDIIADPITMNAIKTHNEYRKNGEDVPGTKSLEDVFFRRT